MSIHYFIVEETHWYEMLLQRYVGVLVLLLKMYIVNENAAFLQDYVFRQWQNQKSPSTFVQNLRTESF